MNDKLREALDGLYELPMHRHPAPMGVPDMPQDCVMLRDIEALIDRALAQPSEPGLDEERLRRVFHEEYQRDESGDRYFGCHHVNQHRSTWDCQQRADEFLGEYARLASEPTDERG